MQWRRLLDWGFMLMFVVGLAAPAWAGQAAVAGINGKIQGLAGKVEGDDLRAGEVSLTVPLGAQAGLQVDGAYGELGENQLKGVALHLFSRHPENYLLGILGAHAELENVDLNRAGLEGELYHGPVTLASFLGYQLGDVDDTLFGTLDLRWYPAGNLMLAVGGSIADSKDSQLHLGAEYQIVAGLTAYLDLATGENHYEHALFGLRYYFGGGKTLIRRHREDDPSNPIVSNVLQGLNSIRKRQQAIAMHEWLDR
jgi:hypothetical protein